GRRGGIGQAPGLLRRGRSVTLRRLFLPGASLAPPPRPAAGPRPDRPRPCRLRPAPRGPLCRGGTEPRRHPLRGRVRAAGGAERRLACPLAGRQCADHRPRPDPERDAGHLLRHRRTAGRGDLWGRAGWQPARHLDHRRRARDGDAQAAM
ncbi:MAG: hypothetical protein AVDCRST_MAG27-2880, partial [uncultured Craurococcus sp.]